MGFRIPAVAVSPYARGPKGRDRFRVDHGTFGHESILKLISYRFGLGYLTRRHRYTRNIGRSFDWTHPDFDPPGLPDPPEVAATPCTTPEGGVFDSHDAHASDLAALDDVAERYRVPTFEGKPHQLFRQPDKVRRALRRRAGRPRSQVRNIRSP
jgi:phospholipase C